MTIAYPRLASDNLAAIMFTEILTEHLALRDLSRILGQAEHPSIFTSTTISEPRATPVLSSAIHDGRDMTEYH